MRYIFILALCALMGCEEKEVIEPLAITPSGWPEAIFKNKSRKSLSETFTVHCAKLGATIVEESETRVKCDENISESVKEWGRMFLGTGHSSDIHAYIQFNLIKRGADTHVQVIELMKLQMPGGRSGAKTITRLITIMVRKPICIKLGGSRFNHPAVLDWPRNADASSDPIAPPLCRPLPHPKW